MFALIALTAALNAAPAAEAAASDAAAMAKLAPAFRGTIISTYPDGGHGRLLINRDHTYRYIGRTNVKSGGSWGLNSQRTQICLKQRRPIFIPIGYCTPIPKGRSWTAKSVDGQMVRLHVVAGRKG